MAMLRTLAQPVERMVARPATMDDHQKIASEAGRRLCGVQLAAVEGTRPRNSVHSSAQTCLVVARTCPDYAGP